MALRKKKKEKKRRKEKSCRGDKNFHKSSGNIYLNEKELEKVFIQGGLLFPLPLALEQAGRPPSNNKFTGASVNQPRLAGWPTPRIGAYLIFRPSSIASSYGSYGSTNQPRTETRCIRLDKKPGEAFPRALIRFRSGHYIFLGPLPSLFLIASGQPLFFLLFFFSKGNRVERENGVVVDVTLSSIEMVILLEFRAYGKAISREGEGDLHSGSCFTKLRSIVWESKT